jgi:hypothetical protein
MTAYLFNADVRWCVIDVSVYILLLGFDNEQRD